MTPHYPRKEVEEIALAMTEKDTGGIARRLLTIVREQLDDRDRVFKQARLISKVLTHIRKDRNAKAEQADRLAKALWRCLPKCGDCDSVGVWEADWSESAEWWCDNHRYQAGKRGSQDEDVVEALAVLAVYKKETGWPMGARTERQEP